MPPRIAIPMPHSIDREYGERAIPQYERAVVLAGGEPVRIPLDQPPAEIIKLIDGCHGVVLPGSNADIDPARFQQARSPNTANADARRDDVDELLLDDAYTRRKPVLGICYGLQSLNVYRKGSLIQHIPDFLPEVTRGKVNHEAGKNVSIAHAVEMESGSLLGRIIQNEQSRNGHGVADASQDEHEGRASAADAEKFILTVNSSHHQSADAIGEGLRAVARCPDDGIIEALEGTSPDHFVVAVQWHPERSVEQDVASAAIFRALVIAASEFQI